MSELKICCIPGNPATGYAAAYLKEAGLPVTEALRPDTTHVLLPVPTKCEIPRTKAVIVGGNLPEHVKGIDLLKDPEYLARNAAITARCAMSLIGTELAGLPVLILGWGRIGKCLCKFLADAGALVTVAARDPADVAITRALGYDGIEIENASSALPRFRAIVNTVPAMVLPAFGCPPDCVLLELASKPGMTGNNIINGRGLPGRFAPRESGKLIGERFLALVKEELE